MDEIPHLISKLPKVELHSHLGGVLFPNTARRLSQKYGIELGHIFNEDGDYISGNFDQFLLSCDTAFQVLRAPEDYSTVVHEYLTYCSSLGVLYSEIFVSPLAAERSGVGYGHCLEGLAEGIERAEDSHDIICRLIPIAERHLGPSAAVEAAALATKHLNALVVGFGMAGDERTFATSEFKRAFDIAREAGLGLTCHAGELCGPSIIIDTLDSLKVSRIGHCVRAIEDKAVIARLKDEAIALEVCPGSNISLSIYPDFESHPLRALADAGLVVTLNSDDPPFFKTDMANEYYIAHKKMHFGLDELVAITLNSIDAAFCDDVTKRHLHAKTRERLSECGDLGAWKSA